MNNENPNKLNEAVKKLEHQELMTRIALEGSKGYTWESNSEKTYLKLGDTFEKLTGINPSTFGGDFDSFFKMVSDEDMLSSGKLYNDYIEGKTDAFSCEFSYNNSKGERRWYLNRGKFTDETKKIMAGVTFDITEQKNREQQLVNMAYKDHLTGLYNLQYLSSEKMLGTISRFCGVGLILTDIAGFSKVNELFGHDFGNLVLLKCVKMFCSIFSDNVIVRVSGDRFLICLNAQSENSVKENAKQLHDLFAEPLSIENQLVNINLKIGVCFTDKSENINVLELFKDAEIALHYAKRNIIESVCVSNESLKTEINDKHIMEFDLHNALVNNEFALFFQPTIDAKTKRVIGCEALIRWKHPKRGLVSPLQFIPLAEETGLIIPIGDFVIAEAARNLKLWRSDGYDIYVSVNVSARQFSAADFVEKLNKQVLKYDIPPSSIVLEITESLMITDFERISSLLASVRKSGIKISLDDFGTGYSSMNYLCKMPIDNLKIDKSFLDNVLSGVNDKAILETIVNLAQRLGLYVTAEGVENSEQVNLLEHCGCDTLQGFLFSKPLPAEEFIKFLHMSDTVV